MKLLKRYHRIVFLALIVALISQHVYAQEKSKKGILLVTFGTSIPEAKKAFDNIDAQFKKAFPDTEIRWAYTSKLIRKKLKRQGESIDSPAEALAKMGEDGFSHVAVQSLHMIPGVEYDYLLATVQAFNKMPKGIKVAILGKPLMFSHEDMNTFARVIIENIGDRRKKFDAVVFMGHGTHHMSNVYYPALQYYTSKFDKDVYIATVEGYPSITDIIPVFIEKKYKRVLLVPLMSVAGDHAVNDMSSNEEDSWKSILEKEGLDVECLLNGMAEYDNIVDIWISHLGVVMDQLLE